MKVLFTAIRDWANHGYIMSKCLQSVGIESTMITQNPPKINYGEGGIIVKNPIKWNEYVADCDVLIIMHSQYVGTDVDLTNKKVLVFHTGTKYRSHYNSLNTKFNAFVDATLVAADIFELGNVKNEFYVPVAVDTNKFVPNYTLSGPLFVGHYPTQPTTKGGPYIKKILPTIPGINFEVDASRMTWEKHLLRLKKCDIYIEDVGTHDGKGNPQKGGMGLTALEAAAMGNIVISRMNYIDKYERELGKCGIQVIQDPEELPFLLNKIVRSSKEELIKLKKASREWVERVHSYKAVGMLFKTIIKGL